MIDRDEGFTLLEMLIAFLILSTALVVANQSISSSVKAFSTTKDIRATDRLASEIFIGHLDDGGAVIGEEIGRSSEGYAWRIGRMPASGAASGREALRASVSVYNPQGKLVRTYVTYFVAPNDEQGNVDH
ncbi:general secretion pathway protein I [Sinorhizobium terangae]|nr:type II secretion system protein [Sinorhizobium terangae]MBB4187336.1 general secretion pathway protein I [Sinorhizobium terangae]